MQNRIEPICFEEGLTGGVQQGSLQGVAELVERSAEVFIKEMLSRLLSHARSNAADGMGVQTNKFKRQLRKEESALENGTLQRNAAGLLPVQMDSQAQKETLTAYDLRLSLGLRDGFLDTDHFLEESIWLNQYTFDNFDEPLDKGRLVNGIMDPAADQKASANADADAMTIDGDDLDLGQFRGVASHDTDIVMTALDDCLLAAG
jgi:transcriptional coactivator HFI1/ADA1